MKKSLMMLFTLVCSFSLFLTGCQDLEDPSIVCYTRNTTSGTRDGFFTGIGFETAKEDNQPLVTSYKEVDSNASMMANLKADENGIGYISLATLEQSGLKGLKFNNVDPTEENVVNGTYTLTRNFNYIIRSDDENASSGKIVRAMLAYLNTSDGKALIRNNGGIVETLPTDVSWSSIKDQYEICNLDNSSITITVAGSTSVKEITSKLLPAFSGLCGNFKYEFAQNGSGDAYKRTQGSEANGANRADIAFASREFKSDTEQAQAGTTGRMCIDAIVAVVNKNNQYTNTNSETLKAIYSGEITKWSNLN